MDFESYALYKSMTKTIPPFRSLLIDRYVAPGMRILDVGCGDGVHLEYSATRTSKDLVSGTEVSQIRTDRVRAKGFTCHKVDSCDLPFADESFNVAMLFEVIEHLHPSDARHLLREIGRVLVSGGVLIGTTPNYPAKFAYNYAAGMLSVLKLPAKLVISKFRTAENNGRSGGAAATSAIRRYVSLFRDDPTHVFRCNFGLIESLGKEAAFNVEIYQTFRGYLQPTRAGRPTNAISRKVAFVFRKRS